MSLTVSLSVFFGNRYDGLPERDLDQIDAFWTHCENHGLTGWEGKVTPSWIVPDHYPDAAVRRAHAKANDLWHAHVGIPVWKPAKNPNASYKVSDWVLHFTYNQSAGHVKLVDYGDHDYPFELPGVDKLV